MVPLDQSQYAGLHGQDHRAITLAKEWLESQQASTPVARRSQNHRTQQDEAGLITCQSDAGTTWHHRKRKRPSTSL